MNIARTAIIHATLCSQNNIPMQFYRLRSPSRSYFMSFYVTTTSLGEIHCFERISKQKKRQSELNLCWQRINFVHLFDADRPNKDRDINHNPRRQICILTVIRVTTIEFLVASLKFQAISSLKCCDVTLTQPIV